MIASNEHSLAARAVTVTRSGRNLVDDVSLSVQPGELVVLMGENGAGKSTLLKMLSGDLKPDGGDVRLAGKALSHWKVLDLARRRAVLPQETLVAFPFTALEVAVMGRSPWCHGYPGQRDYASARAALERVDAWHLANRRFPTLSGGERARVQLARAMCQVDEHADDAARFLLLDEPIAALDIAHQHLALAQVLECTRAWGTGAVAVLHDLNLAAQYADRVVLMKRGRVEAAGLPRETLTADVASRCFATEMVAILHPERGHPILVAR